MSAPTTTTTIDDGRTGTTSEGSVVVVVEGGRQPMGWWQAAVDGAVRRTASTTAADWPPGLTYERNVVTPAEADALWASVCAAPWSSTLQRRTQQYGFTYDYRVVPPTLGAADQRPPPAAVTPLPAWSDLVVQRLLARGLLTPAERPQQLLVNEYEPGQGIGRHVDQPHLFGPTVVSLSLGSGCEMEFQPLAAATASAAAGGGPPPRPVGVYLEPRSVVVLRGAARYHWTHEIRPRCSDRVGGRRVSRGLRVSLTLRTLRRGRSAATAVPPLLPPLEVWQPARPTTAAATTTDLPLTPSIEPEF